MNIRQAILLAADSIEQHPQLFHYSSTMIPNPECGTSGCALGWIAHHLGVSSKKRLCNSGIYDALGIEDDVCFDHLRKFAGSGHWKRSAKVCAKALRQYANHYYPITDHIPSSVREIFDVRVAA